MGPRLGRGRPGATDFVEFEARLAETKDVVDPVLFLLSDQCEVLNGAKIPIEGGFWST